MKTETYTNSEIVNKILLKIQGLELHIKPTIDDRNQFERNCKNEFMRFILGKNKETLNKHKEFVGKKVFKFKKSFGYTEIPNPDTMNPTKDELVLLTEELYKEFENTAVTYWIKHYSDDLIKRAVSENSTSKLRNLQFEWEVEMKQELIKFYHDLIGKEWY